RPLLGHVLARLGGIAGLDGIVVTTSTLPEDDAVARFAREAGTECWRGPLDDVLGRMAMAASAHRADAVLRISGDSPLLDPRLVARAIQLFRGERDPTTSDLLPLPPAGRGQGEGVVGTAPTTFPAT